MKLHLRQRFAKNCLSLLGLAFLCASIPALQAGIDKSKASQLPPVNLLTAKIWTQLDLADFTLTGDVRTVVGGKTMKHYPIVLRTHGHQLVYEFTNQALQVNVLIKDTGAVLQRRASPSAPWVTITGAELRKHVLDTDITYDDLALNFINWDNITPIGTDSIKTLPAYAYEAIPGPQDTSSYAKINFWVSTQYWAFLRIDGVNGQNQTVKRVEVQSVMTIGDYTCFKEMKVETMVPGLDDIASSYTLIDIDKGVQGSGLPATP